jgi:uncharacterized RmlC-like cupin family protein
MGHPGDEASSEERMSKGVRLIRAADRTEGGRTPGMIREEAVATGRTWAGVAITAPGAVSGWHHHGDHESTIYVLAGALRMEFGPGGGDTLDAKPDDFLYVAPDAVHRESNPSGEELRIVVVRSGSGEPVVNVEGPEQPEGSR